ncbi:hypothetical protein GGR07_002325 [Bacteroides pyogenes]|nr:hypothetical protein [Bacteroides pyogenes]
MKKTRRALKSNTAGFEKKAAGFFSNVAMIAIGQ